MKPQVFKHIELTDTSPFSIEDAVNRAIKRAHETINKLCWFQLVDTCSHIVKGKIDNWQVTIKVGFVVEG